MSSLMVGKHTTASRLGVMASAGGWLAFTFRKWSMNRKQGVHRKWSMNRKKWSMTTKQGQAIMPKAIPTVILFFWQGSPEGSTTSPK